jgi:hypothetical protein
MYYSQYKYNYISVYVYFFINIKHTFIQFTFCEAKTRSSSLLRLSGNTTLSFEEDFREGYS